MPENADLALVKPMLAQTEARAFSRAGWAFELKYDGVRAVIACRDGAISVHGRSGSDETLRYPEAQCVAEVARGRSCVIDSEIVALDDLGRPSFHRLQNRIGANGEREIARRMQTTPASVAAFDLLELDGNDLTRLPLVERKTMLRELLAGAPPGLIYVDHVEEHGDEFFQALSARGLEGMVAKRLASSYQPGVRSHDWVKVKAWQTQTCCVVGFTRGTGSRAKLGALALAARVDNSWRYAGNVGSGFTGALVNELVVRLEAMVRPTPPVVMPPRDPGITWVRTELYCEVRHSGFTPAGALRHPVFLGLRTDVGPDDCKRPQLPAGANDTEDADAGSRSHRWRRSGSRAGATATATADATLTTDDKRNNNTAVPGAGITHAAADDAADAIENHTAAILDIEIDGFPVHLTNLQKQMWPGIAKRSLIAHYVRMAPWLVPHLSDRGVTSQVFPDGIAGKSFWRKQIPDHAPDWLTRWTYSGDRRAVTYIVADSAATVAWLANSGSIDVHPWHSRIDAPFQPDWAVFDLDPSDGATFDDVLIIARLIRVALEHTGMRGYPKTTGQTGLQIYVPINRGPSFDEVRGWVEEVARAIGRVVPEKVTWEWTVSRRDGKVRIDYTQNIINKTLAAPYSVRPAPNAPVSVPIAWGELDDPDLRPDRWTIATAPERIRQTGDLFAPVLHGGQELPRSGRVAE